MKNELMNLLSRQVKHPQDLTLDDYQEDLIENEMLELLQALKGHQSVQTELSKDQLQHVFRTFINTILNVYVQYYHKGYLRQQLSMFANSISTSFDKETFHINSLIVDVSHSITNIEAKFNQHAGKLISLCKAMEDLYDVKL